MLVEMKIDVHLASDTKDPINIFIIIRSFIIFFSWKIYSIGRFWTKREIYDVAVIK